MLSSPNKKLKTMNIVLIALAIFLLIFTSVMIWLFYKFQTIPDQLCMCVFCICGTECGAMAWIRTTKDKLEKLNQVEEENEE